MGPVFFLFFSTGGISEDFLSGMPFRRFDLTSMEGRWGGGEKEAAKIKKIQTERQIGRTGRNITKTIPYFGFLC